MLKLEDFKIKEIETLETITGGTHQCLDATYKRTFFLGWIVHTEVIGDIHDD